MTTKLLPCEAKELFSYDPESGDLFRKYGAGGKVQTVNRGGYIVVNVRGTVYYAHRLAWMIMTGDFAPKYIDHVNGCGSDNRWSNLRRATQSQNAANARKSRANTSGVKGVVWYPPTQKWRAQVSGEHRKSIGYFATLEEAAAARAAYAERLYGEFARH